MLRLNQDDLAQLFPGDSELATRMRDLDWSKTDLGPTPEWPENLRHAVRLCLTSRIPIVMYWGEKFTVLYNDAYISFLGTTKHPRYLGQPGYECWSEIWDTIEPMFRSVYATQKATWSEDLQMFFARSLPLEEVFVRFTFGPILAGDGRTVDGIFCPCTETTEQVVGARRLETLRRLGVEAAEAQTVDAACAEAMTSLAVNPHDVPFAALYLVNETGTEATLTASARLPEGVELLPRVVTFAAGDPAPWPLATVARTHQAIEVSDFAAAMGPLPGEPYPEPSDKALVLPITAAAHESLAGLLVVGVSPRRPLDPAYRTFFELVAGHLSTTIANARAYEAERKRAEVLAELDRAKTTFFANVSHEFRTPLTLMLGPLEDLLDRSYTDLTPATKGQLEVVHRNSLRLLKLVNTLLDFSRIEAGRIQASYEPVDLAASTAELASVFRAAIERAGLRLVVNCPPLPEPAYVDCDMWEKIVLNLLSNAFKFTLEGEIEVRLEAVERQARLTVRDTGVGIPAEEMPRVFERFHRVNESRGRTHEGTGIGLALVQELVKLHGGTVQAQSVLNEGSQFTVIVPLGSAHLDPQRIRAKVEQSPTKTGAEVFVQETLRWLPEGAQDQDPEQMWARASRSAFETSPDQNERIRPEIPRARIVWADDNADMREYVARLLGERYEVAAAADGQAALEAARANPPDLVLSDVMMPRLDGFGLLRELRADPQLRDIPIILLSARAGEEARVEGMEAGADDYLIKPFSARELLARVDAHIKMAHMRTEMNRALRESEERLRLTLDYGKLGMWEWDLRRNRSVWNVREYEILGYPSGDGQVDTDLFFGRVHPEDAPALQRVLARVMAEESADFDHECRILRADDGQERWIACRGRLQRDEAGRPERMIGVNYDITEKKLAEEALHAANAALTETDRRKDEFLAMLAHELRNPLAPIRYAAQMLCLGGLTGPMQKQCEVIGRQVGHMGRLLDDLLDVSRITQGKIHLKRETIDLRAVIEQALDSLRPMIEGRGQHLGYLGPDAPLPVDGDPTRLEQIVRNLLHNAHKYTDAGGCIGVRAGLEVENGQEGWAVIGVRDSGVGIAPEILPHVFEAFVQAEQSLARTQGGLGIGLAMVKRLVQMHDGRVEARSAGDGHGSEFVVRLPLVEPLAMEEKQAAGETGVQPGFCRVLVVEDNVDAAASLSELLELWGHAVQTALSGESALEVARDFRPDVVLLDIGLPGMDGYAVAHRLRTEHGQHLVLVALTGYGQAQDRAATHAAGFNHHLVKPVDVDALRHLLNRPGA